MKIKKLDELIKKCSDRTYRCDIFFDQNAGLQIFIGTKYLKGGNPSGKAKELYYKDMCKNSKKMIKGAIKWLERENFREREQNEEY